MPISSIDGAMFKDMLIAGSILLEKNKQAVDALNVFPVPDGDTGTNMSHTMSSAVRDLAGKSLPTVSDVANTVARGALKGARGNSGVILSQILRGFSKALDGREEIDAKLFAQALRQGADTAYKAVMKPKEGTILTVARVIAEKIETEVTKTSDMLELMQLVMEHGDAILKKTPEMLPVLAQAGVVDSGGKGLMVIYSGFLAVLKGETVEDQAEATASEPQPLPGEFVDDHDFDDVESIKYGYCTEFIVSRPRPDMKDSDVANLRKRLTRIGDCVLAIGDLDVVKVHVHTDDPGKALQMALELGEIDAIKINNMREECRERIERNKAMQKPVELKDFGFVSVALGSGFASIFADLQVDKIVDGGQTMNPSIEDIANAIDSVPAKEVFVLPNNSNIILAAQQAKQLTEKTVHVIETKSVPMGIAATLAFDPSASGEDNAEAMKEAAANVHTASVTFAVRDTTFDNHEIHEGDIMGLIDNKISLLGRDVHEVSVSVLEDMVTDETALISVYYGEEVDKEAAQKLTDELTEKYPDCDVELFEGGQPLYYYLISVE